jgi:hypothetical protein
MFVHIVILTSIYRYKFGDTENVIDMSIMISVISHRDIDIGNCGTLSWKSIGAGRYTNADTSITAPQPIAGIGRHSLIFIYLYIYTYYSVGCVYANAVVVSAENFELFTQRSVAAGTRMVPSGSLPFAKKKRKDEETLLGGRMDVWGLNTEGSGSF